MRTRLTIGVLLAVLIACTDQGPPQPDFFTLESINSGALPYVSPAGTIYRDGLMEMRPDNRWVFIVTTTVTTSQGTETSTYGWGTGHWTSFQNEMTLTDGIGILVFEGTLEGDILTLWDYESSRWVFRRRR